MGYLEKGDVTIKKEIYVIKNLHKSLLGRPAIRGLNLMMRVSYVKQDRSVIEQFSSLLRVLVSLRESIQSSYKITQSCSL